MHRIKFFLIQLFSVTTIAFPQTLFEDARSINKNLDINDTTVLNILSAPVYIPKNSQDLFDSYRSNIIINPLIITIRERVAKIIKLDTLQPIQAASFKDVKIYTKFKSEIESFNEIIQRYNNTTGTITEKGNELEEKRKLNDERFALLQKKSAEQIILKNQFNNYQQKREAFRVEVSNLQNKISSIQTNTNSGDSANLTNRQNELNKFIKDLDAGIKRLEEESKEIDSVTNITSQQITKDSSRIENLSGEKNSLERENKKRSDTLGLKINNLKGKITDDNFTLKAQTTILRTNNSQFNTQLYTITQQPSVQQEQQVIVVQNNIKDLQSSLIDATSSFIADRFQQEIATGLMKNLANFFRDDSSGKKLAKFFPSTAMLLKNLSSISYSNIIQALRATVQMDINNFYLRLPEIIKTQNASTNDTGRYLYAVVHLLVDINNGMHPQELIGRLASSTFTDDSITNLTFRKVRCFSDALTREPSVSGLSWISTSEFRELETNAKLRSIFLGLMIQRLQVLQLNYPTDQALLWNGIQKMYKALHPIDVRFTKLSNALINGESVSQSDLLYYGGQVIALLEIAPLYDSSFKSTVPEVHSLIDNIQRSIVFKDYATLFYNSFAILRLTDTNLILSEKIVRYSSLLISIANAKNNDDIKNAINAAALPPGSYTIKRESPFNISINNFTGITSGIERVIGVSSANFGFTSPTGFALSLGGFDSTKISHTFLLSVFDFGAVVNFRVQGNNTALPEAITIQDILSPGIYYFLGFANLPVALGASISYSPSLRAINANGAKRTDLESVRYNISLVLDIPIFDIMTTPK